MIHSLRAILRYSIPDCPPLVAGTLVLISDLAFQPGNEQRLFPGAIDEQSSPLFWLSPVCLLPSRRFLRIQPRSEFWMLALKQPLRGRPADQFLADPVQQGWGPKGFRFESIGELIFYVKQYQLDSHTIELYHVRDLDKVVPQLGLISERPTSVTSRSA